MTYFAKKLSEAVGTKTKLASKVRLAVITVTYSSQVSFEREMANRRRVK